jgi:hypothetical protein
MVVAKGMIRGLNGDLMQQMGTSSNRCFGTFPKTDFSAILWPPPPLDRHRIIGWATLEKGSREYQKSILVYFGTKKC